MPKMNARIFFVDNNAKEILSQWEKSKLSGNHTMIDFTPFESIKKTIALIVESKPNIIVLGHHLKESTDDVKEITGVNVLDALHEIEYPAVFISNTGGDTSTLFPHDMLSAAREGYGLYSAIESAKTNRFEYLGKEKNLKDFRECIQNKQYAQALLLMKRVKGLKVEQYVYPVLNKETIQASHETVRGVIKYFIDQREDLCPSHGYWVHSVSHFDETMWKLGLKSELQFLLRIAILGANELSDENCCERLISKFFRYSAFNDKPSDFGITQESIEFHGTLTDYENERIKRVTFADEAEYIRFKLQFADCPCITEFTTKYQLSLINEQKVHSLINRLNKISSEPVLFETTIKSLYKKQIQILENLLEGEKHRAIVDKLYVALQMTKLVTKK